jgi:hypothetical protein
MDNVGVQGTEISEVDVSLHAAEPGGPDDREGWPLTRVPDETRHWSFAELECQLAASFGQTKAEAKHVACVVSSSRRDG